MTESPFVYFDEIVYPKITALYSITKEFVKKHQGEKGYISTDAFDKENEKAFGCDTIYGYEYCEDNGITEERIIYAIRVVDNKLQVLMRPWLRTCNNAPTNEEIADDKNWDNVFDGVITYYYPTLLNIAEYIEEYV